MNPLIVQAVIAAIHMNAAGAWECNEMGGAIVEKPSGELKRAYVEFRERGVTHVIMAIEIPRGDKLVAIWHTHPKCPAESTDTQFSEGDIEVQHKLGVPSFIFVQMDDSLRMYYDHKTTIITHNLL